MPDARRLCCGRLWPCQPRPALLRTQVRGPGAGLASAAFIAIVPSYISRSGAHRLWNRASLSWLRLERMLGARVRTIVHCHISRSGEQGTKQPSRIMRDALPGPIKQWWRCSGQVATITRRSCLTHPDIACTPTSHAPRAPPAVAGSYDLEAVAIFALVFVFYMYVKTLNTGESEQGASEEAGRAGASWLHAAGCRPGRLLRRCGGGGCLP